MKDATEKLRELCDNIHGDFRVYPSVYGSFKSIVGSTCTLKLSGSNRRLELELHNEGGKTDFYVDIFKYVDNPTTLGFNDSDEANLTRGLAIKDIKDLEIK